MSFSLHGISAAKGIAIGRIHIVERGIPDVTERRIRPSLIDREVRRFLTALGSAKAELDEIRAQISSNTTSDIAAFIDTHMLMLEDAALAKAPVAYIREHRCNAEWALKVQRDAVVSVFDAMDDPYLKARRDDVNHVVNRVQQKLLEGGRRRSSKASDALVGRIIYADDFTPADTLLMQKQGVAGFLTEFGGPNSHTAILARSLQIPAVVGLHGSRQFLRDDDEVVVDGRQGVVLVDPDETIRVYYRKRQREIARIQTARRKIRRAPTVTADGERVVLQANVELPDDIDNAVYDGAAGIGLYRTEFLFMNRATAPDEAEQYEAYAGLVRRLRGSPVTIRTLDLGADKQVDGERPGAPASSNPALGLRAVRLCLREPGLFRPQVRAILKASSKGPVRMMIPMLSTISELDQVIRIVDECKAELRRSGDAFDDDMPIGAMIEVPAAAICADIFAKRLAFLSIGTNDLIQYTIAIDRVDDEVSYLYDPLHPAVLRLVQMTIQAGRKAQVPVAMCGEMAGDARYTRLLLGLGLREFSVHPSALLEVKQIVTETHVGPIRRLTQRVMRAPQGSARMALIEELNAL